MSVHYKFKNTITYDAIKFDGVYISATDLKAIIVQQKKLGHSELQVTNEETNEVYTDDSMIPKNTNVIVSRLPFANSNKRARYTASQNNHNSNSSGNASGNHHSNHHHHNHHHHHNNRHHDNSRNTSNQSAGSSLDSNASHAREALELVSTKNMTEEEKIKYIQSQSTKDFDPARYARGRGGGYRGGRGGGAHRHFVPGPGYTCRKCGIPGHSIYDCKMSTMHKVKRSSGIPRDFLMKVDSKEKGALMTPSGEYAVPYIDREAYNNPKVEKAPFFEDGTPSDDDPPAKRQATAQ